MNNTSVYLLAVTFTILLLSNSCNGSYIGCNNSLGARFGGSLNSSSFSSSSDFSTYTAAEGRLYGSLGWIPMSWSSIDQNNPEYLQVDFLDTQTFDSVTTTGLSAMSGFYVPSFKLSVSNDGVTFTEYKENGESKTFDGPADSSDVQSNKIKCPFQGRYLRFIPMGFGTGIGLQVEAYGCSNPSQNSMVAPVKDLAIMSINTNTVFLQWNSSSDNYQHYVITIESINSADKSTPATTRALTVMKKPDDDMHIQQINKLTACTLYRITIKPSGICGYGSLSQISVSTNPVVPPKPRIISALSLEPLKIHLLWEEGLQDSRCISNISGYIIQYNPAMSADPSVNRTVLNSGDGTAKITTELSDLVGWTKYEVRLIAFGPYGESLSAIAQVDVDGKAPTEGPIITRLVCLKPDSFTVSWQNPPTDKSHGSIKGFSIHYKTQNETQWLSAAPQSLETAVTISNLNSWMKYDVYVMLHIGKYNSSSTMSAVTVKGDVPLEGPLDLRVDIVKATSVSLKWTTLSTSFYFGTLDGYVVRYKNAKKNTVKSMMTPANHVVLSSLEPETTYNIKVYSSANGKESTIASLLTFTTPIEETPITAPTISDLTSPIFDTIMITWTHPVIPHDGTQLTLLWREKPLTTWNERQLPRDLTGFTLVQLKAWKEYEVMLRLSSQSQIENSTIGSVLVIGQVPGEAPSNIKLSSPSTDTVQISWDTINPMYQPASFNGYTVYYNLNGSSSINSIDTTKESLTISDALGGNTYTFTVAATSKFGSGPRSDSKSIFVTKKVTPPKSPIITSLASTTSKSVKVIWTQPLDISIDVNKFLITATDQSKQNDDLIYTLDNVNAQDSQFQMTISGLLPFTLYSVSICATTIYKGMELKSKPSVPKTVTTLSGAPSAPGNVTAIIGINSAFIQWREPSQPNGLISKYSITVHETKTGTLFANTPRTIDSKTLRFKITQLKRYTNYTVAIRAFTTKPGIIYSMTFISAEGAPSQPMNVSALANSTHINVHWLEPKQPQGQIKGYRINYAGSKPYEKRIFVEDAVNIDGNKHDLVLTNVIPGTNYEIHVTAKTSRGFGSDSSPVAVWIPIRVPSAPPAPFVDLASVTATSVTIEIKSNANLLSGISSYQVVVQKLDGELRRRRAVSSLGDDHILGYSKAKEAGLDLYVSADIDAVNLPPRFVIGDGNVYNGYFNAPLQPMSVYRAHVRATTTDIDGDIVSGASSSIDLPRTAPRVGNKPVDEGFKLPLPLIAGAAGGLVFLIIIIVIIIVYLRSSNARRKRAKEDPYDLELSKMRLNSEKDGQRPSSLTGDKPLHPDHPPILINGFQKHVNRLHRSDNSGFKGEYNQLEIGKEFSWEIAHLGCNKAKNRYANIVAYDHSRVLLQDADDEPGSNYINASYIDGYMKPNAYVATQGPLPSTFDDFWRMVWELRSSSVIMLTNLQEKNKLKCHKYWPDDETEYGQMKVTQINKELYADYTIRVFQLRKRDCSETREVRQFHFTVWPDHGVPQYATAILAFRRRARAFLQRDDTGPTVVHCSAGVGRTGTYIAIDSALDRMSKQGDIDIFNYIAAMRTRRIAMVQTEEQYIFVHDAVLESIVCGNTQIPVQDLRAALVKLDRTESDSKMCGYEKEWKTLNNVSPILPKSAFTVALLTDNVNKNRYSCVVPADLGRVELLPIDDEVATTYINAVYVDGYKQRNAFILTQSPLPNTTADFWRMLCEHRSGSVVMLNNLEEGEDYTRFWPDRQCVDYEMISVETLSETLTTSVAGKLSIKSSGRHAENEIIIRKFKVTDTRNPDSHFYVKIFQYLGWTETKAPPTLKAVISLAGLIEKWQQRSGNGPITIMCSDGLGRSGTFASLVAVLERLKVEQVVDVFQTVKAMRIQRPHLVKYLDQYKFIHLAVQEYLSAFDDYANFK